MKMDLIQWLRNQSGQPDLEVRLLDVGSLTAQDTREWLIGNGKGSFACASITGANTRRYHGLFVGALEPPVGRTMLFSRIDEKVNGEDLATNLWSGGSVNPHGYKKLVAFTLDPVPTWLFQVKGGYLIKQVAIPYGQQHVVVGYTWVCDTECGETGADLQLRLLVNSRDFHAEMHAENAPQFSVKEVTAGLEVRSSWYQQLLKLSFSRGQYMSDPQWYHNYYWPREFERGLGDSEDAFHIGHLGVKLGNGQSVTICAGLDSPATTCDIADVVKAVDARHRDLLKRAGNPVSADVRRLVLAADAFPVWRNSVSSDTILAGYHWFNDWGRDSMISLPGLTLSTGRPEIAKGILTTFRQYLSEGMLPNNFPDKDQKPDYNTSDATLWWAWALLKYYEKTGDREFIKSCLPDLVSVVDWHVKGTRYNLKMDPTDGLISGGAAGVQLTWMDAKCGDYVVTPRAGKAVEINALWFNFLKVLAKLHIDCGADGARFEKMAQQVKTSFAAAFWNAEKSCLFDVIREDGSKDSSVRPNQLMAISLQFDLLTPEQARSVLWTVEAELLTPFGMRSLSPYDPQYQGIYGTGKASANQYFRDITYHQGTVWSWLVGPWVDARIKVYGQNEKNFSFVSSWLAPLRRHVLESAGMGSISEIFDGDHPHKPQGCIAQAWSVAELLRVLTDHAQLQ